MNKKTKIIFTVTALFSIICCLSAQSQFFTIKPKEVEKAEKVEKIVADSRAIAKEAGMVTSVNNYSGLDDGTKLMLNGMRKRQYLSLPVDELKINSPYGYRTDPFTGKRKLPFRELLLQEMEISQRRGFGRGF
jgi:murein DD-endopeptidase MepM/ murein hydrolase activator NlpD